MNISALELFSIGIGPSSSHTVGPMRAGLRFAHRLEANGLLSAVAGLQVALFGSLAATGKGHGTDKGVLLGLMGEAPETCDPDGIDARLAQLRSDETLPLLGKTAVPFRESEHLLFRPEVKLPQHPNGLRITAFDASGKALDTGTYLSIGGGFIVDADDRDRATADEVTPLYPFDNAAELLARCASSQLTIAELMLANESVFRPAQETRRGLLHIWEAMQQCILRGMNTDGELPGPLHVRRRAAHMFKDMMRRQANGLSDDLDGMDWLNLYAMAVSEENAAGGRIVTAPTNGAAGIIPAVMYNYVRTSGDVSYQSAIDYLLTAAAIGLIYKRNASISGAEVGCQGEVGVACSMAAGALCAVLGGTPKQVEYAAEIGMEHNLGLTCDPVGGMVQIPCIERNAIGAAKAVNAARMALRSDGNHYVSLDAVIKTMLETGHDMLAKYKETSLGGLAIQLVQC